MQISLGKLVDLMQKSMREETLTYGQLDGINSELTKMCLYYKIKL
jgi:hypothetical protein